MSVRSVEEASYVAQAIDEATRHPYAQSREPMANAALMFVAAIDALTDYRHQQDRAAYERWLAERAARPLWKRIFL